MTIPPRTADSIHARGLGRTLVALFLAACLLGALLPATAQAATAAMVASGHAGVRAAPGDEGPSGDLHHHVVRKKHRRTELVPVAAAPCPRAAPASTPPAWVATALPAMAAGSGSARPAFARLHRGPALPAAPQLRLRPGQAPPAA